MANPMNIAYGPMKARKNQTGKSKILEVRSNALASVSAPDTRGPLCSTNNVTHVRWSGMSPVLRGLYTAVPGDPTVVPVRVYVANKR